MPSRVLIVDDSAFFRHRIEELLKQDKNLEIVGSARNGKEAIEKTLELRPDVITMDIEMPVMDGITAVREIMGQCPTPILMFSSLTTEGAQATLEALEAGAMDFLPKKIDDISADKNEAARILRARVRLIAARGLRKKHTPGAAPGRDAGIPRTPPDVHKDYHLLAIGTSTGGPLALQEILTKLPENFPLPVILIQHMPSTFTRTFAQRLDSLCQLGVKEAEDGDVLKPGHAYLAPGGKQMLVKQSGNNVVISIVESEPGQHYKPCVDTTFRSIAETYSNDVLAMILTGMGSDGREGARALKKNGSTIWAQDEETSVIYGMPAAVVEAGLAECVLPLSKISETILQSV
jgi:two-component system chemotaxis response regulator CheB